MVRFLRFNLGSFLVHEDNFDVEDAFKQAWLASASDGSVLYMLMLGIHCCFVQNFAPGMYGVLDGLISILRWNCLFSHENSQFMRRFNHMVFDFPSRFIRTHSGCLLEL